MLVEVAIGDAYSAGFEYTDSMTVLNYNDLSRYLKHPRQSVRPGYYTVDTQMCMALAEVIIAKQRNGPIGKVPLRFLGAYTRFENRIDDLPEEPPE